MALGVRKPVGDFFNPFFTATFYRLVKEAPLDEDGEAVVTTGAPATISRIRVRD